MVNDVARNSRDPLLAASCIAEDLAGQGADAVVLVGSHARGDALAESDVDIIAVGDGEPYRLMRFDGWLVSISWVPAGTVRELFRSPRDAPGVVPGWRSARVLVDPDGIAGAVIREATDWTWGVVGDDACNAFVAEEICGLAEELHKLVNLRATGNLTGAAVQRAILSFRLGVVMATHRRILFDTENHLWRLVNQRLGEAWTVAQSRAFGLDNESFDETCDGALDLYRLAAREANLLFDDRQREVVDHACALAERAMRKDA